MRAIAAHVVLKPYQCAAYMHVAVNIISLFFN